MLVSSQVSNIFQSMCQCVLQYYNRSWHHNVELNHMPLGQLIMCSLLANARLSEISVLVTGACQSLFNFLFTHPFYVRTVYKRCPESLWPNATISEDNAGIIIFLLRIKWSVLFYELKLLFVTGQRTYN